MDTEQYVEWFRSTSPYINSHRGKTFVLSLSGDVLAHPNFSTLVEDLVLLHSLGVRLVLCFGGETQIVEALQQSGFAPLRVEKTLLVDNDALAIASAALSNLRTKLEVALSSGIAGPQRSSTPLRCVTGNFVTAKPIGIVNGLDHQHSGQVRKIDAQGVNAQLQQSNIVLQAALAGSPTGELFVLDELQVACAMASTLGADKLILFSENDGVLNNGLLVRELNLREAEQLLHEEGDKANRLLKCAINACNSGVERTQIVSYVNGSALLTELFSRDGSGTLVSKVPFETIRTATIDDIAAVLELIAPLELDGTLVRRSREKLEEEISYFSVIERDTSVIACAALYPFAESAAAELACVVTAPEYRNSGRAARLLEHMIDHAQAQRLRTLFVLTTKTAHWFIENGFTEIGMESLPETKQALYNMQRSSKVLQRIIDA